MTGVQTCALPILCLLLWIWSSISFVIYHRKLIPIYSLSLTIDNLVCGSICGSSSPWISCYCLILFSRNLCGSRCLPCLFENVFFPIKFTLMEDKPFSLGTLCHCEKCIEFGLFVWTLLFLGVLYLFPSYMFYFLNKINLWACVALFILYAQ